MPTPITASPQIGIDLNSINNSQWSNPNRDYSPTPITLGSHFEDWQSDAAYRYPSEYSPRYEPSTDSGSASIDGDLKYRMYGNTAATFGQNITEADKGDGRVGWGTVAGSTISGAGTGAAMTSSPYGAVIGGIVGFGTGMYAKYEGDKSARALEKARKNRQLQIYLQQKQFLEKNKDRLALEGEIKMEDLQSQFEEYRRKLATQKSTAVTDRMKAISDSINEYNKPSYEAAGAMY